MKFQILILCLALNVKTFSQSFEGILRFKQYVKSTSGQINLSDLKLDSLTIIEVYIKGDSILWNRLNPSHQAVKRSGLKIDCQEYMINHETREIKKAIYPPSAACYEGNFTSRSLRQKEKKSKLNPYTIFESTSKSKAEHGLFWIDDSYRFSQSTNNALVFKNIGLVVKSKIESTMLIVETELLEARPQKLDADIFAMPSGFIFSEFHAPAIFLN